MRCHPDDQQAARRDVGSFAELKKARSQTPSNVLAMIGLGTLSSTRMASQSRSSRFTRDTGKSVCNLTIPRSSLPRHWCAWTLPAAPYSIRARCAPLGHARS